jgi:hypothetical protein
LSLSAEEGEECGGDDLQTTYMSLLETMEDPLNDVNNAPTIASKTHSPSKVGDFKEKWLDMFSLGVGSLSFTFLPGEYWNNGIFLCVALNFKSEATYIVTVKTKENSTVDNRVGTAN